MQNKIITSIKCVMGLYFQMGCGIVNARGRRLELHGVHAYVNRPGFPWIFMTRGRLVGQCSDWADCRKRLVGRTLCLRSAFFLGPPIGAKANEDICNANVPT